MSVTLPNIDINFIKLAKTFVERSERGIGIFVIKESIGDWTYKTYTDAYDLEQEKEKYSEDNYNHLHDILEFGINSLHVVRIDEDTQISEGLDLIDKKFKTGWVTFVGEDSEYQMLASWIKKKSKEKYTFKGITYGLKDTNAPDHECIVNLMNPTVTFLDEKRGKVAGKEYLPSLMGIFASCNVKRGVTYFECKNLKEVEEVADNNAAVDKGQFILINDFDIVRIGLSVNSLTSFGNGTDKFEDMRFIDIMEAIHMITDDVREVYKTEYIGKMKNHVDNQMLFISGINTYFKELADEEVLDSAYDNLADINVDAQRKAWIRVKDEAKAWDDATVKNRAFQRTVFLKGDVKINGAMENLAFDIYIN